jgi:hypothetical protein
MSYIHNNPRATPDEIRVGEFLNNKAEAGEQTGAIRVEGTAERPNIRTGDYSFFHPDAAQTSADLMQPQTVPGASLRIS